MEIKICDTCKFSRMYKVLDRSYEAHERLPDEEDVLESLFCRRFPQKIKVAENDWCGEWATINEPSDEKKFIV